MPVINRLFGLLAIFLLLTVVASPSGKANGLEDSTAPKIQISLNTLINPELLSAGDIDVADTYPFFGLSRYLNEVNYYVVSDSGIRRYAVGDNVILSGDEWLAAAGRFNVLLLQAPDAAVEVIDGDFRLSTDNDQAGNIDAWIVQKSDLRFLGAKFDRIRYAQLWAPMALLTKGVEWLIVAIQRVTQTNWAVALILFSVLVKILLIPAALVTTRLQQDVNRHKRLIAPKLASIKESYSGEEAHNRTMMVYKEQGITPFFTLKPMVGLLVQIPVLIAIFNALGEMPQFLGVRFLWIKDMAYPDVIVRIPSIVPWFGNTVNMLPFMMLLIAFLSALAFSDPYLDKKDLSRKRAQLVLMGFVFFIFFYPFPVSMTLYWLCANFLYILGQRYSNMVASNKTSALGL